LILLIFIFYYSFGNFNFKFLPLFMDWIAEELLISTVAVVGNVSLPALPAGLYTTHAPSDV
ncbi:hypothetical protein MRO55_24780, partial [Escherichia coli]|uniref:hypothetical protein n=1 Tax=Escherichia coli TaxID=562 RepID=UPI00211417C7